MALVTMHENRKLASRNSESRLSHRHHSLSLVHPSSFWGLCTVHPRADGDGDGGGGGGKRWWFWIWFVSVTSNKLKLSNARHHDRQQRSTSQCLGTYPLGGLRKARSPIPGVIKRPLPRGDIHNSNGCNNGPRRASRLPQ